MRTPSDPKHLPQIIYHRIRPLPRRKVPTLSPLTLKHHGAQRPRPQLRQQHYIPRKPRNSNLGVGDVLALAPKRGGVAVRRLVVDPEAGRRTRGAKVIHRHPGQDLLWIPRVVVAPVVQLFVDPRQQADGGVRGAVAEGLGLGGLQREVAHAGLLEVRVTGEAGLLGRGEWRGERLGVKGWVRGCGWLFWRGHVEVVG